VFGVWCLGCQVLCLAYAFWDAECWLIGLCVGVCGSGFVFGLWGFVLGVLVLMFGSFGVGRVVRVALCLCLTVFGFGLRSVRFWCSCFGVLDVLDIGSGVWCFWN